jgi:uncharacterized protein YdhG (YjbR/CyaY superfamily)
MLTGKPKDIDEYIAASPVEVQEMLELIRQTISKAAPKAEEKISYGMPAFTLNGKNLVYFAAFKNHIGFYAAPTAHEEFKTDFSVYKTGRGSVQFPLDKPMPLKLIAKVVKFKTKNQK